MDDDDSIYGGYDDYDEALDVGALDDNGFQEALKTAYGKRPALKTAMRANGGPTSGFRTAQGGRGATAMRDGLTTGFAASTEGGQKRLMTAVTAARFTVNQDVLPQQTAATKPLEMPEDTSPEAAIRKMEERVHRLIEESAAAIQKKEFQKALDKAKEAGTVERQLNRKKEMTMSQEAPNVELTFSVLTHLACVQEQCEMYPEAISTLQSLIKSKPFDRAGRLHINVGNIRFKQKKYLRAVKEYQMALDQISSDQQELRNAVLRNIGHAFVAMGQYGDAMKTFEHVLDETPIRELDGQEVRDPGTDFESAFNAILCYFALGDRDKMKRGFIQLLSLQLPAPEDDDRYLNVNEEEQLQLFLDAVADDDLRQFEVKAKKKADQFVTNAAKLIAPVIEGSFADGYDWCIERVKSSPFLYLAAELEITKAISFLKTKNIKAATQILKGFEKKESNMLSTAATNLSFLYLLEKDIKQALRYVDVAVEADKYNPYALVNKGTCMYFSKKYEEAQEHYQEALAIDSSCVEALFNMGLVHRELGNFEDALDYFDHVNVLIPDTPEVLAQVASISEAIGDQDQAIEKYSSLISLVPSDPNALAHLGDIFDEDDKSQAFQYHFESYRYLPSDIHTVAWFSSYHVEAQAFEKAIQFLEKAVEIEPGEVKWRMRIAACWKRTGNYQRALETYKKIHTLFPDNIECLTILVRICSDLGLTEADTYAQKLKKAEQTKQRMEQRAASGRRSGRGSARRSAGKAGRHQSGRRSGRTKSGRERDQSAGMDGRTSATSDGGDGPSPSSTTISPMGNLSGSVNLDKDRRVQKDPSPVALDASYKDPIGSLPVRPKTSMRRDATEDEDWADIDDDIMLPE